MKFLMFSLNVQIESKKKSLRLIYKEYNKLKIKMSNQPSLQDVTNAALATLYVNVCSICSGKGHYPGQCGTLKNLDKMMLANPFFKQQWIKEKQNNINTEYHKKRRDAKTYVYEKMLGRKRELDITIDAMKKTGNMTQNNFGFTNNNSNNNDWNQSTNMTEN